MTKNDLINLIVNNASFNKTLDTVSPEYRDDFKQHFYLQLCEITEEKLIEVYNRGENCLEAFAATILTRQLKSNKSSFHRIHRAQIDNKVTIPATYILNGKSYYQSEDIPDDISRSAANQHNYDNIIASLNSMHPKKVKIFLEHHKKGKTAKQISEQYGIKLSTVYQWIRSTEEEIKAKVKYTSGEDFE